MPPRNRFIILAAPRTGSNLLCTLLNSHPAVLCHHELFNPNGIFYALDHRDGSLNLGGIDERDQDPAAFLERVWANPCGASRVGFKMTRGQHEQVIRGLLDDPRVGKIILRRRNRIKTYVSELVAQRTNQWEAYQGDRLVAQVPKVRVEPGGLRAHSAVNEAFYQGILVALRSGRQPYMDVAYEDIFSATEHQRMLGFLQLEDRDAR